MSQFRKLMLAVFGSGTLAGLVLFAVQHFTVVPLIRAAETYEAAGQEAHSVASQKDEGWQPAEGWERTSFTALTTVLTGIGFAAMLFGLMALARKTINTRHGALWGLWLLDASALLRRWDCRPNLRASRFPICINVSFGGPGR